MSYRQSPVLAAWTRAIYVKDPSLEKGYFRWYRISTAESRRRRGSPSEAEETLQSGWQARQSCRIPESR